MGLGEVLQQAAKMDLAGQKVLTYKGDTKSPMRYTEEIKEGRFEVRLFSTVEGEEDVFIENSIPYDGSETTENYARMYLISMVFNSALWGMRKSKEAKRKSDLPTTPMPPFVYVEYEGKKCAIVSTPTGRVLYPINVSHDIGAGPAGGVKLTPEIEETLKKSP